MQLRQPIPHNPTKPALRAKEQSVGHPIDWVRQIGTDKQQNDVLMQINSGLVNGSISPAQASQFKDELNKINDKESWYKSFNTAIPANLKQENVSLLNQISSKLKPQATKSAATQVALHGDVDELIGSALAKNHISSGQAESYYLRLAQLESNIESTKNNPATPSSEIIDTNKQLAQLKSELLRKVN